MQAKDSGRISGARPDTLDALGLCRRRDAAFPVMGVSFGTHNKTGQVMRRVFIVIGSVAVVLLLAYAHQLWENNKAADMPDQARLQLTLEKAIDWLDRNRASALAKVNPPLWRMVQQAAEITGDPRLRDLFDAYRRLHLEEHRNEVWRPLFYPGVRVSAHAEALAHLPYYDQQFIYASLCDQELGNRPEIRAQSDPSFCDQHLTSAACVTHQLMGIRLLQRSNCGDAEQLADTVRILQQRIRRQLILDPRVVKLYMQRVLMLVESGGGALVKPVWIKNLIDAQRADGGWNSFDPLVPLAGDRYFGYGSTFFAVARLSRSGFDMTAQGVLLFSLLTESN